MNLSELRPVPPSDGPNPLRDAALAYARAGLRVFPVHGWRRGVCTCGDPSCDRPAKHPLTSHGLHDATTNEATILRWWAVQPHANVAILAEDIGLVLDVDPRNGGAESLDRLLAHQVLPDTVEVHTGGGGVHYWLRTPRPLAKGRLGHQYPGIDMQAAGSYVIAPPSMHASGRTYEFEASSDFLAGQAIGDAPDWLLELRGEAPTLRPKRNAPALSAAPGFQLEDVRNALAYIEPDEDYHLWIRVGQALHAALWDESFDLWDQWSARGAKYPGTQRLWRKWQTFDANGPVNLSTVFYLARERGMQPQVGQGAYVAPAGGESMLVLACDLPTDIRPPEWLIEDYFEAGALSCLFGEPGAGKSFIAIDIALSIATGKLWHGQPVKRAPVVYLCGEGHSGLQRRMHAWRDWHQIDWRGAPFALTKRAVPLINRQAIDALRRDVDAVLERLGGAPGLFVVDTLARNFGGGGDENSTKDMTAFIDHVGAYLIEAYRAAVMLMHHTGHADKQRIRGSSALKGAVDAEYHVQQGESRIIELSGLKMKDAPIPATRYFAMRVVELGQERPGKPMTSIVPVPTGAPGEATLKPPSRERAPVQGQLLDLLLELYARNKANLAAGGFDPSGARVPLDDWRSEAITRRLVTTRQNFYRLKTALLEQGAVFVENGIARVAEGASTDA